jgi:hypothetical protein
MNLFVCMRTTRKNPRAVARIDSPLANLGRSLGLSISGPNLSKSISRPNNLTAKIARWALFVDFQGCYHDYFEPRQAQDAPADPKL